MKLAKEFSFETTLFAQAVRDCKIVTVPICNVVIEGVAYCYPDISPLDVNESRYQVDIDCVWLQGCNGHGTVNIKDFCDAFAEGAMDYIHEQAMHHAACLGYPHPYRVHDEVGRTVVSVIDEIPGIHFNRA